MEILIVDPGGRGHAIAKKIAESPLVDQIFMAPGNPGTEEIAENTGISHTDIESQIDLVRRQKKIGMVVISADDPLAAAAVDRFEEEFTGRGLHVWGPSATAFKIESSKSYAKDLMANQGIPTAQYEILRDLRDTKVQRSYPAYVKKDGLYAGKGVTKASSPQELQRILEAYKLEGCMDGAHPVIVEEALSGVEVSLQAFCDGTDYVMVPFAMKDHKTIYDNDTGPMTGGMSVIGPVPYLTPSDIEAFGERFVAPVLAELAARGTPFKGMLYPGLRGWKVLEYNGRPGDAETQVWAAQLESDLMEIMLACCEGSIADLPAPRWRNTATACIVLAAKGYPEEPEQGAVIRNLDVSLPDQTYLLHAGTKRIGDIVVVGGGRVINVMSVGSSDESLRSVIDRGYDAASLIQFDGKQMRSDVGDDICSQEFERYIHDARQSNWQ